MDKILTGKHIAILATDGFEQSELLEPKKALEEAGASTTIVSLKPGKIRGWKESTWGDEIQVHQTVDSANCDDFDGILLPGGVMNPDKLRDNPQAVDFVRDFVDQGKVVAAICHGPWILINAEAVSGKMMTSYSSIKMDLINAGANWIDRAVVTDHGLITSRKPADIPEFNQKLIEEIAGRKTAREVNLFW